MKFETPNGTIAISNEVIATIASSVAQNCFGVKGMARRSALDGLVHLLRREVQTGGVEVCSGESGVLLTLHIAVSPSVNIQAVCRSIAEEVRYNVQQLCGIPVERVDLYIDAVKA